MKRQEDLQVKLRERQRRLLVADRQAYLPTLKVIRNFLAGDALIVGLLEEARLEEPDVDHDTFFQLLQQRQVEWTHTTEGGQATLIWSLIRRVCDGDLSEQVFWMIGGTGNLNDAYRAATEALIAPLFDYLVERVGEQSSVLHALERFVRSLEWFDRDSLIERYDSNPSQGEDIFNRYLREFLFREGIDLPFTEAQSPSGESDALSQLESEDPLVCEVKVFDGLNRDRAHVATGVHQALLYAEDYGKSDAYLVVINVSGRPLQIVGDADDKQWPQYLDVGGVRVFVVVARARRLKSASKSGPAKVTKWSKDQLLDPDSD